MQSTSEVLDREVRSGFARFLAWAAVLAGAIAVVDATVRHVPPTVLLLDGIALALLFGARVGFVRGWLGTRAANPAAALLTAALVVNTLVAMRWTGDLAYTIHIAVEVLVAASLLTSTSWFVATGITVLTAWGLASPGEALSSETVRWVGLAASFALGLLVMRYRKKLLEQLVVAAEVATKQRAEAMSALAHARTEMEERERVEHERESLRGQFLHAQKMEGVGTLAAGVIHDMNNVLSAATTLGAVIREQVTGTALEDVDNLLLTLERGAELTHGLLAFSRRPDAAAAAEAVVARNAVETVVRLVRRTLPKGIVVEVGVPASNDKGELAVACDPAQLSHAILNLCINASDAMNGKGRLGVTAHAESVDEAAAQRLGVTHGEYVVLSVQDNGCGMDEETRRRATEPFFTTKGAKGSGLGLAMVSSTMRNHNGVAVIESGIGRGTTVHLYLPRAPDAVVPARSPPSSGDFEIPAPAAARKRQLLVVDDDGLARRAARRLLERLGHTVTEAEDGGAALTAYRERGPFDVVLLDVAMPGMDGLECLMKLKEGDPSVHVVMVSASSLERDRTMSLGAKGFIPKPLAIADLDRAISSCPPTRDAGS